MRWPTRRHRELHPPEPIERIDPASLEVVELDAAGSPLGPRPERCPSRELAYAAPDRDPTSLAGVWEALAES